MRELYLVPFEMAVREGGALGIMTAYNRLNGAHCSDSPWLLRDVLRDEWGFDGFVVSDWFALAEHHAIHRRGPRSRDAGPGPGVRRRARNARVTNGEVDGRAGRRRGATVARASSRAVGALDDEPAVAQIVAARAGAGAHRGERRDGALA